MDADSLNRPDSIDRGDVYCSLCSSIFLWPKQRTSGLVAHAFRLVTLNAFTAQDALASKRIFVHT